MIPNKLRGRTTNTKPTKTDQSGARDTDLNIIVKRMITTGTVPGASGDPLYGDFSALPRDYRAFIHQARDIEKLRGELPPELANLTVEDLVMMDDKALADYLKPKEPVSQGETEGAKE